MDKENKVAWMVEFTNKLDGTLYGCMLEIEESEHNKRYVLYCAKLKMDAAGIDVDNFIPVENGVYLA